MGEGDAQGVWTCRLDALVGGPFVALGLDLVEPRLLGGAELGLAQVDAGPQPDHVEMQAEHARFPLLLLFLPRMVEGRPRRDDGAPIAALHAVGAAIVELFVDEGVPQAGDGAWADRARAAVVADRRTGEAVAGQGGRDDVESI